MTKPASLFHPETEEVPLKPKDRRRLISGLFEEHVYRQFTILAAEIGMHRRDLVREALNDVFAKYGKPPIA